MPVSLTGKIIPLNAGFVGMVDNNQIIDSQATTGNVLASDGAYFQSIPNPFSLIAHDQAVIHGGTGLTTIALGSILAANTADILTAITSTTGTKVLTNTAGVISWATGGVTDHGALTGLADDDHTQYVLVGTGTQVSQGIAIWDSTARTLRFSSATVTDGSVITGTQLVSTIAIGSAPIFATSTTVCANLNADLLDGQHASAFLTSVTAHNILSTTHGDTLADSVTAGDILIGNATPKWARLAKGTDGKVLTLVSGLPSWETPSGGGYTNLTQFIAQTAWRIFYSNTDGDVVELALGTTGKVLTTNGATSAPTWETPTLTAHNLLSATHGDTTASTVARGDLVVGIGASPTWDNLALGTVGKILRSDGTDLLYTTSTFANTYAVSTILYASSANVVTGLATGNSGLLVTSAGGVPSIATDIPTAVTIGTAYIYRVGGTDVAVADGGTGTGSYTIGDLLIGNNSATLTYQSAGITGSCLRVDDNGTTKLAWIKETFPAGTSGITATFTGSPTNTYAWKLDINSLTADTSPSSTSDSVVTYDFSATAHKKVLISNLLLHCLLEDGTRVLTGNWLTSAAALEIQFRETGNKIYSSATGTLDILGSATTNIGVAGDIVLGDGTLRTVYPQTTLKEDLGKSANYFNAAYIKTLNLQALLATYNNISTVSGGVPAEYATVDLTAQSAAITATTLYAVPAAGVGMYRVSWVATITTAATTSCVLGGTAGFQLKYTDGNDSVVKTSNPTTVTVSAVNATGTSISGTFNAYCKASTNLQYLFDYTSVGATPMQYNLHIKCESL